MAPAPTRAAPKSRAPTMLTSDLALRFDPAYEQDLAPVPGEPRRVPPTPSPSAWYKLTPPRHGPGRALPRPVRSLEEPSCGRTRSRPSSATLVVRRRRSRPLKDDVARLRPLGQPSWSRPPGPPRRRSATTDKRGGANGARIRLEPQRGWAVNAARAARAGRSRRSSPSARSSTVAAAPRSPWPTSSCWPAPSAVEKAAPRRRASTVDRAVPPRVAPTPRRSRPTSTRSAWLEPPRRRLPQLRAARREAASRRYLLVDKRLPARPLRAGDDGRWSAACARSAPTTAAPTHGVLTERPGELTQRLLRQPARRSGTQSGRPRQLQDERLRDPATSTAP